MGGPPAGTRSGTIDGLDAFDMLDALDGSSQKLQEGGGGRVRQGVRQDIPRTVRPR
ncbi:hypothetical protein GCM10010405_17290 [Streptomyces macrosporus]|uniref:Uncharacterized protein n=1 Tax=Streptomyces macrosporus TaxID=44032 RepID=A0ABN3JQH1_9ACTN